MSVLAPGSRKDKGAIEMFEGDFTCMERRSPENLCIVHKRIKVSSISNACQIKPLEEAESVQIDHKSTEMDVEGLHVEATDRLA